MNRKTKCQCGQEYEYDKSWEGQLFTCEKCSTVFEIPNSPYIQLEPRQEEPRYAEDSYFYEVGLFFKGFWRLFSSAFGKTVAGIVVFFLVKSVVSDMVDSNSSMMSLDATNWLLLMILSVLSVLTFNSFANNK